MSEITATDVAAQILQVVENFEGTPQELLEAVTIFVDNWGQEEYDQALEDYDVIKFEDLTVTFANLAETGVDDE